jgi:hypothetical protein
MVRVLRRFLEGRATRSEVAAWTRRVWPDAGRRQGGPFPGYGAATSVFDSIWHIEAPWPEGGYAVRDSDVESYLDWLTRGEGFVGDDRWLLIFDESGAWFRERYGLPYCRYVVEGLGWKEEMPFVCDYNGRPFVALADSADTVGYVPRSVTIYHRRGDARTDSLRDLFETLALDESDCSFVAEDVDLSRLQRWTLWRQDDNGNEFEVGTYGSYAKALRLQKEYESRGHKQMYSVAARGTETQE